MDLPLLDHESIRKLIRSVSEDCGKRVQDRRVELGLTEQTLADAIGTNLITVKRIERGEQMPRDRVRYAIAFALATDVEKLFPYPDRSKIAEAKVAA